MHVHFHDHYTDTREEKDGYQINTGCFSDETNGSLEERGKGDLEEIAKTKSNQCDGTHISILFMLIFNFLH